MSDEAPGVEPKQLPMPTGCVLWQQPDLVTAPRGRFETVETYTHENLFVPGAGEMLRMRAALFL